MQGWCKVVYWGFVANLAWGRQKYSRERLENWIPSDNSIRFKELVRRISEEL
jgi:hypothetical protein